MSSSSSADVSGVHAKLDRAEEHLRALERDIRAFLEGKPCAVIHEWDPDSLTSVTTARINREPPTHMALVAGDCVHNLRSALDYLINSLVVSAGNEPNDRTAFPIFKDEGRFRGRDPRPTKGLTQPMMAAVERLQPFNAAGRSDPSRPEHPLVVLRALSNWDKHRLLILCIVSVEGLRSLTYHGNLDVGRKVLHAMHPEWAPVLDRKSTRLNSSHIQKSRMPSSA